MHLHMWKWQRRSPSLAYDWKKTWGRVRLTPVVQRRIARLPHRAMLLQP